MPRPRRSSLSTYDRSGDASPQARQARRQLSRPDNRVPETRGYTALAGDGCWCGEPFGHGWPGKADGASHPR
jgi:hypothetical protein